MFLRWSLCSKYLGAKHPAANRVAPSYVVPAVRRMNTPILNREFPAPPIDREQICMDYPDLRTRRLHVVAAIGGCDGITKVRTGSRPTSGSKRNLRRNREESCLPLGNKCWQPSQSERA